MTQAKGLMRFPAFVRSIYAAIRQEQPARAAFNEPSLLYPELRFTDIYAISLYVIVIFSLRMFLQRYLTHRLFRRFGPVKRSKIGENLFYSIYYVVSFLFFALVVNPEADWSTNLFDNDAPVLDNMLKPFPPPLHENERTYYAQALGFYISATVFLLAFDTRRSDFSQLFLHHTVTLSMVTLSKLYGYVRAGMLILALHDFSDIFLYSAKVVHYLGYNGWDTVFFVIFAVSFYIARLVMYSRLVHTIVVCTISRLAEDPPYNRWAMFYDTYLPHYFFFVTALCTLLCLHCFWFSLILKVIYREIFTDKKLTDVRSDDEGEEEIPKFEKDDDEDAVVKKKAQ